MSANSKIEWTDHTFNPWIGCTKVSPGCAHCYAESEDKRRGWTPEGWGKAKPRKRTSESYWKQPLRWNAVAAVYDRRPKVFCASLADWLDDEVPIEWLADLLALIHATPNLDWLLLTKRPENWTARLDAALHEVLYVNPKVLGLQFAGWVSAWSDGEAPANVWIGTSVEDQKRADARIPQLLQIPAKIRFLSCEPLLGPVNLGAWLPHEYSYPSPGGEDCDHCGVFTNVLHHPYAQSLIDWIIVGGESGPKARQCNLNWILDLIFQCVDAEVPLFVKQLGGNLSDEDLDACQRCTSVSMKHRKGGDPDEWPEEFRRRQFPSVSSAPVTRVKKRPGFPSAVQLS